MAVDELNSLISLYRKQLGMRNLEFMSVSGITHLVEVINLVLEDSVMDVCIEIDSGYIFIE